MRFILDQNLFRGDDLPIKENAALQASYNVSARCQAASDESDCRRRYKVCNRQKQRFAVAAEEGIRAFCA